MVICVKSYDHFETSVRFFGLLESCAATTLKRHQVPPNKYPYPKNNVYYLQGRLSIAIYPFGVYSSIQEGACRTILLLSVQPQLGVVGASDGPHARLLELQQPRG
eukprot:6722558-Pyramimonas_sp.AAC.1